MKEKLDKKKETTPIGGLTYEEIGRNLGISKQGVRKIEKRAIRKIRKKLLVKYGMDLANVRDYLLHE